DAASFPNFNFGNVENTEDGFPNNFNFGNGGNGDDGDNLWAKGETVPIQNPVEFDFSFLNPTPPSKDSCHPNYCQVLNPCNSSSVCVNSQECNKTMCQILISNTKKATMKATALPKQKKDFPKNNCANVSAINCPDPENCFDLFNCVCKPGFAGINCLETCDLACVPDHGECRIQMNVSNYNQKIMHCNCHNEWGGDLCETAIVDPEVAASIAHEKEQKARVMIAVLAGAAALAVCAAVVTPIVLWRLRVIFVLKLIYFFKPYDNDEDKLYDAYVSMSSTSNAEKFVYHELRPKLEDCGFKLYLQARDNCPGKALSEDILEAVEKSRCTIMIVTQDYISSEWNRFEYLIAQHESLKLRQKIIPIILEKLEKETTMEKALKHILASVKCLKYPQQISVEATYQCNDKSSNNLICVWNTVHVSKHSSHDPDKQKAQICKAEEKFWKCLELTMPKIKKPKNNAKKDVEKPDSSNENSYPLCFNSNNDKLTGIQLTDITVE
ncbi:toll-like receptor 4 isoform X2, partial [Biomphalaria pfeifferi]